jgi:hypothetical protein
VARIQEAVVGSGILSLVRRLYVTGAGDPFASPLYWSFLKSLHLHALHPKLTIFLHTNGLLFDSDHWIEMGFAARSRVTEVGISVDAATEDTYRFIRGASWKRLWDNVGFINRLQGTPEAMTGQPIMLGMFYTVQARNFRELIPFARMAFAHKASWISVTALRNWGTFTAADYLARAVHLPGHPDYAEFRRVIADPELTRDRRINMDSFDPKHTDQEVIRDSAALLPLGLRKGG